eukprot:7532363-Pyramimonas_sp.AAC.1
MAEAFRMRIPPWLVVGNVVADALAGAAADAVRVAAPDRARVHQTEHMAMLVRRRLLRATLDAIEAENGLAPPVRRARKRRRAPPAARLVAAFSTSH